MLIVFTPPCFLNYFGIYGGYIFYFIISYQLNPLKYSAYLIFSKVAVMALYLEFLFSINFNSASHSGYKFF